MAFRTESLESWRARQLARVEESRAFSNDYSIPAPRAIEQIEFELLAGRIFWNRNHVSSKTDFLPKARMVLIPTGDELRGPDAKRMWGRLYFIAAEILFAVVEADMTLTPAEFGRTTPTGEIIENAKAVSELLAPRFAKYFLALQPLNGSFNAETVIDWIGKQNLEASQSSAALELMAA